MATVELNQIATFSDFFVNNRDSRILVIYGGAGSGKCKLNGSLVVKSDGRLEKVENLEVGDSLMGPDSTPRKILEIHKGRGPVYEVRQNKGDPYFVTADHILVLKKAAACYADKGEVMPSGNYRRPRGRYPDYPDILEISVKDWLDKRSDKFKRSFLGMRTGVEFPHRNVTIDPYWLGLWLGDGTSRTNSITTMDHEVVDYIRTYADMLNEPVKAQPKKGSKASTYSIGSMSYGNGLCALMRDYNLLGNKHIPDDYLYTSREARLALLAGILDSDGNLQGNCYDIIQKSERFSKQIKYLANSLGLRCSIKKCIKTIKKLKFSGEYYRLNISGNTQDIPLRVAHKRVTSYNKTSDPTLTGIDIFPAGDGDWTGFTLDGDSRYLTEDFTITHNSVATAQHLVLKLLTEKDVRMMIARKTLPALKITAFQLVKDILNNIGVKYHLNKTEMTLTYNDNTIYFRGLDDSEKVKSVELNYVWIEEATDVTQNDINQLNLRMRRANENGQNQMYLTFNPIDANHHIITKMVEPARHGLRNDITIHHSTYKTNPFLDDVYIEQLENLINIDENFYRVYALGEPGVLKGLVLTNWRVADAGDESIWHVPPLGYGVDFGFNAPTTISALWFRDDVMYFRELYYKRKQTNADLIDWIAEMSRQHPARRLIHPGIAFYADSAEPARIEEFGRAGIPTYPADKNVSKGLEILKSHKLVIHPESVNLIKELQNYKYKPTKDGDGFVDEVVKAYDHCLTGNTLVITERGEVPISAVTTDDCVLTHDGSFQRVLWSGMTSELEMIVAFETLGGTVLRGTASHPIYTENRGWVPLGAICNGDILVTHDARYGTYCYAVSKCASLTGVEETVYNLHVENNHNFFANGILVHNCIDACRYIVSTANVEGMVIPIEAIKKHSSDSSAYIRGRGIDSKFPYDPMDGVRSSVPFKIGLRPPGM